MGDIDWHVVPDGTLGAVRVPDPWRLARWAVLAVLLAYSAADAGLRGMPVGLALILAVPTLFVNLLCDRLSRHLRVELTSTGLRVHDLGWRVWTPGLRALVRVPSADGLRARVALAEVARWETDDRGLIAVDDQGVRVRVDMPMLAREAVLDAVRPAWERARAGLAHDLETSDRSRGGVRALAADGR